MIRQLALPDLEDYLRLRREAVAQEPLVFGSSPADDRAQSASVLSKVLASPDEAIFGAFAPDLVGAAGIYRESGEKSRHKVNIWGVYVSPAYRGRGLGRALVEAALRFARSLEGARQVQVCVTEHAKEARALYQRLGFLTWGIEPDALRVGDMSIAEHHMILVLTQR
ncbi:MAG TPA: GNAT family N-acetyltransferase [Gemmatimonadales bacterium]|nr:GNAT family N-acetyltransferase [Gemmatimonadales bacterium]